jgi:hypothetical protein
MDRSAEVLVLVSFFLQLFLFFTGGLRQRTRNPLLRCSIWVAYAGADLVAIYALGVLSRDANAMENGTASLWAPFLLIHLGGQDTITAFSMEDSSLWKRHVLNLLVQVTLALYAFFFFWKPSSTQVLFPGVLLFAAGIIKYGERTAALMQGDLSSSMVVEELVTSDNSRSEQQQQQQKPAPDLANICADALRSAPGIRMLFAGHTTAKVAGDLRSIVDSYPSPSSFDRHTSLFTLMDVELAMVYSDLYTKAAVLRTRAGIVFRCISLACTVAALTLFFFFSSSSSSSYSSSDGAIVITYTLFIGGLAVDVCSLLKVYMASPWAWAWAWLRHPRTRAASRVSRCLLSWWDMTSRPLWSNTMGQYRFVYYDDESRSWSPPPSRLSEVVMCIVGKLVGVGRDKGGSFCLNRLLKTKQVVVDDNVTLCLVKEIDDIATAARQPRDEQKQQQWWCLGQLLLEATQRRQELANDFARLVSWLHACTETLLCQAADAAAANKEISIATGTAGAAASADVCRKLSRYMMYLVAANPGGAASSLLQEGNPEAEFRRCDGYRSCRTVDEQRDACMRLLCDGGGPAAAEAMSTTLWPCSATWDETLEELKHMWARLLVYAASRSRPEAHAAALARGGELFTFVWLLLSHHGLGASSTAFRVEVDLVKAHRKHVDDDSSKRERRYYVFDNLPVHMQMVNRPQLQSKLASSTPTGRS